MSAKVAPDPSTEANPNQAAGDTKPPIQLLDPPPSKDADKEEKVDEQKRDSGLFGFKDPQTIKEQVRKCLEKQEPYSVFIYYKSEEESFWPKIAKHHVFENTTLAVITFNAVYIAIDHDWNKEEPLTSTNTNDLTDSGAFFQMMEHLFCIYFFSEWIVRFLSFKHKKNGLKDGWFVFDSLLVFMMVMETWVLLIVMAILGGGESPIGGTSILRLFRLLRLSRLTRMLRSLPELLILIKGMATAMKSVSYVMALLVLITYIFAIAFTQLAVGTETVGDDFCANVAHSMYSLLIFATFLDDLSAFTEALRFEMWPLLVLGFIFIGLAALTVMNMLIGVLCEVVSAVAEKEREDIRTENLTENMRLIVESIDTNRNNQISYKEFIEIMSKPHALAALDEVGVSPTGIVDFAELFFFEDGHPIELPFETFMEVILDLRESNTCTVKDMLNLWMKIKMGINKEVGEIKKQTQVLRDRVDDKMKKFNVAQSTLENTVSTMLTEVKKMSSQIPAA